MLDRSNYNAMDKSNWIFSPEYGRYYRMYTNEQGNTTMLHILEQFTDESKGNTEYEWADGQPRLESTSQTSSWPDSSSYSSSVLSSKYGPNSTSDSSHYGVNQTSATADNSA